MLTTVGDAQFGNVLVPISFLRTSMAPITKSDDCPVSLSPPILQLDNAFSTAQLLQLLEFHTPLFHPLLKLCIPNENSLQLTHLKALFDWLSSFLHFPLFSTILILKATQKGKYNKKVTRF